MKLRDIESEIQKKSYESITNFIEFKIYKYTNYVDIYFTGKEVEQDKIIAKLEKEIEWKKYKMIQFSSRTIKVPYIMKIEDDTRIEKIKEWLKGRLNKTKRIETAKLRFYNNENAK